MLCGGNKPCLPTHGKSLLKEGKNMKKHLPIRLLSMLLVLAMCVGLVVPSFAAGSSQTASLEFEKLFADGESYRMSLDTKFKDMDYTIYIYLNGEVVYTKQYMS